MDNMCPAPWQHRMYHSNGVMAACCRSAPTTEADIALLKQSFLNNHRDQKCNNCWYAEDHGMQSLRQELVRLKEVKFVPPTIEIDPKASVTNIMINIGSYCNAECIICNGSTSSSRNVWAKVNDPANHVVGEIKIAHAEFDIDQYPNLEMITLLGGEPAIHPTVRKLLKKLILTGRTDKIDINLTTNSSSLDSGLRELLSKFRDIFITLSLDGVGDYFEYQRRPLVWNEVSKIADSWMSLSFKVTIGYVVTAISIWSFNDFIIWLNSQSRKDIDVRFDPVDGGTGVWSLSNLTPQQRAEWISTAVDHPLKDTLVGLLANMPHDTTMLSKFKKRIAIEDQTAKKKFAEIFPDWDLDGKA